MSAIRQEDTRRIGRVRPSNTEGDGDAASDEPATSLPKDDANHLLQDTGQALRIRGEPSHAGLSETLLTQGIAR